MISNTYENFQQLLLLVISHVLSVDLKTIKVSTEVLFQKVSL